MSPLLIAAIYALIGGAWILLTDWLTLRYTHNPEVLARIQMFKGIGFIIVTATTLYLMLRKLYVDLFHTRSMY
jgi:hypothetical protein